MYEYNCIVLSHYDAETKYDGGWILDPSVVVSSVFFTDVSPTLYYVNNFFNDILRIVLTLMQNGNLDFFIVILFKYNKYVN